jgi:hypothetical protein
LFFKKEAIFVTKLAKIAKNNYHNIDPRPSTPPGACWSTTAFPTPTGASARMRQSASGIDFTKLHFGRKIFD